MNKKNKTKTSGFGSRTQHDMFMPGDYEYRSLNGGISVQRQWNKNRILLLRDLKFIKKNDRVLDAGCGSGNVVLEFAQTAQKIEGWDVNALSIKFLKSKIKERKLKNASARTVNLLKVKGRGKFSKIILTEVIEHLSQKDYNLMLKNLRSLLISGGEIFITTPNDKSIWPFLEFSLNFIQKNFQKIPTFEERHLGHFDIKKLTKNVEEAGFKVTKSGTLNFISPFLFFVPEKGRDEFHRWESARTKFGSLVYVVAVKK